MAEQIFISLSESELRALIKEETRDALKDNPIQIPRQEEYLTTKELCALLNISQQTRNEWTRHGALKAYKIRGRVYYKLTEVELAMNQICKYKPKNH
jgi:excisionase family DNA binding protein